MEEAHNNKCKRRLQNCSKSNASFHYGSMAAVAHAEGLPDSTVWGWVKEIAELEAKLAQEQNGNFKTCAFQMRRMH